jgi:hypothetical protein
MLIDGRNEKCSWLRALSTLALLLAGRLAAGEPPPEPTVADPSSFNVRIAQEMDAALVRRAISGAFRSLGSAQCGKVLEDFRDDEGRTLASNLETLGKTPQEYLRFVLFYDGSTTPACKAPISKSVFAASSTGSRVILLCMPQFRAAQRTMPYHAEAVVIHEMLHSLGLGENPPTSEEITRRVMAACAH